MTDFSTNITTSELSVSDLLPSYCDIQNELLLTATDLYRRGLNVFPVLNPYETIAWAAQREGRNPLSKPAYILEPLYTSRMHLPDQNDDNHKPLPRHIQFEYLFGLNSEFSKPNLGCMVGRTSGNLVGVDCDTHESFQIALQEMNSRSIPYWAYSSHRGGRIMFRLMEGEAKTMSECQIPGVEIYGSRQYIVLPPSIHPQGTIYTWITPPPHTLPPDETVPLVSVCDLEWLGIELIRNKKPKVDIEGLPEWVLNLSKRNLYFLLNGADRGHRNTSVFSCACDMVGNNIEYEQASEVILDACRLCNPPYPEQEAVEAINSAYKSPRTPAKNFRKKIVSKGDYLSFAEKHFLLEQGRKRRTDKAVFLACLDIAMKNNQGVFRCTTREISEKANLNKETACKSLMRLSGREKGLPSKPLSQPLLQFVDFESGSGGGLYRFSDYVEQAVKGHDQNDLSKVRSESLSRPATDAELDLFGRIGIRAWEAWKHLINHPELTKKDLANKLHINYQTILRVLHHQGVLMKYGLVLFDPQSKNYVGKDASNEYLTEIAVDLKVSGRSSKRRASHRREREKRVNQKIFSARVKIHKMIS